MKAPTEDIKNVPLKGWIEPEEYLPDIPIISQEYDNEDTKEVESQ